MIVMVVAAVQSLAVRLERVAETLQEQPEDLLTDAVLCSLYDLRRAGDILRVAEWELVESARACGLSWASIGSQLGISRQAAHARFAVVADDLLA